MCEAAAGTINMPQNTAYDDWQEKCQAYVNKQIKRNVDNLVKGFETEEGAQILRAEAASRDGGDEEAKRVLVQNVKELTRRKAIHDFMAKYPAPPKKKRLTKKQRRARRYHSRRIVSTEDLKLARIACYASFAGLPWVSFLLPFYFINILRTGQWWSNVITYNSPPPDLSARGRSDYEQFVSFINKSLLAGVIWTVLFIVWIAIFQSTVMASEPGAWALSLIVGNVDPSW